MALGRRVAGNPVKHQERTCLPPRPLAGAPAIARSAIGFWAEENRATWEEEEPGIGWVRRKTRERLCGDQKPAPTLEGGKPRAAAGAFERTVGGWLGYGIPYFIPSVEISPGLYIYIYTHTHTHTQQVEAVHVCRGKGPKLVCLGQWP